MAFLFICLKVRTTSYHHCTNGKKFGDILFAALGNKTISNIGSTLNPIALRMAKTLWSFDRSECNRVKEFANARVNSFPLESTLTEKGGKNESIRFDSPEDISFCLKVTVII